MTRIRIWRQQPRRCLHFSPRAKCLGRTTRCPKMYLPIRATGCPYFSRKNASERAKRTYDNAMANFAGAPPKGPSMRLHASPVANMQMESPTGMDLSQIAILITGREA